jgi:superfamily II DNA or RNA helicase
VASQDGACLSTFDVAAGYSTSDAALLDDFLVPALDRSLRYDRSVGFFSSSLVALAPATVADFVTRGGKVRLVCSPHLSSTDMSWLGLDAESLPSTDADIVEQLRALAAADDLAGALISAMSSLVHHGILEIKFAKPAHGTGIFHDKVGVLTDVCGHRLSFVGSANETAAAWSGFGNHEQIETFASWLGDDQDARASRHALQFEELWLGVRRGVRVSDSDSTHAVLLQVASPETVEVSLERVRELITHRTQRTRSSGSARHLRAHQLSVLQAWRDCGGSGIVVFATGGGKTLTGLAAAGEWIAEGRSALIAVPSTLLLDQWIREIHSELPDTPILAAGAGNPRRVWEENLRLFTRDDTSLGPRIVLSTYDTAVTPDFMRLIDDGPHLMVLADEVHRAGAPNRRTFLNLESGARMGLSATPERYGDPEGTRAVFDYFGERLQPEFGIRDAISAGQLVPYDYDFVTTTLTEDEQVLWDDLSARMARELARNDGEMSEFFRRLARDRSRVLKAAANKAHEAKRVLDERQKPGDRWLVYCESRAHLSAVREIIETLERRVLEYHSGNAHLAREIFACFEQGGVLLAIKCLDEGIDLPFINRALILASTTNPREYIQRRGRVLRTFEDKYSAEVIDMVVVDDDGLPLSTAEVARAVEFADNAANVAGKARLELLLGGAMSQNSWRRDSTPLEVDGE